MPLPRRLAQLNRSVTNRVLGGLPRSISPFAILHHQGRRSGRDYSVPLAAFFRDGTILLPPTYGPEADWVQNILTADSFVVDRRGSCSQYTNAHLVGRCEAWPYLPRLVRLVMRILRIQTFVRAEADQSAMASGSTAMS